MGETSHNIIELKANLKGYFSSPPRCWSKHNTNASVQFEAIAIIFSSSRITWIIPQN